MSGKSTFLFSDLLLLESCRSRVSSLPRFGPEDRRMKLIDDAMDFVCRAHL